MTPRYRSGDALHGAARVRAEERGGPSGCADRIEGRARDLVDTAKGRTVGGELVPGDDFVEKTLPAILDTLASPDAVAADGLERMLAHQLATAHTAAMKAAGVMSNLLAQADRTTGPAQQAACIEAARMAGAFSRLTGSYQAGMQTLQRMRSGGRQTVIVQHNHVSDGGQAVIGGPAGGGGERRNRVRG